MFHPKILLTVLSVRCEDIIVKKKRKKNCNHSNVYRENLLNFNGTHRMKMYKTSLPYSNNKVENEI